MGSWDYGPCDNDSAADWFYKVGDIGLYDLVERGLNSENYYEQRAAAWLIQKLGTAFVYDVYKLDEHKKLATSKLRSILKDQEWIDGWNDSNKIIDSIEQQIYEIEGSNTLPKL